MVKTLSDDQWARLLERLPGVEGKRGPRVDTKLFLEALWSYIDGEKKWNELPLESVRRRCRRWISNGTLQRILHQLENEPDLRLSLESLFNELEKKGKLKLPLSRESNPRS